jgi:hypothetical protein
MKIRNSKKMLSTLLLVSVFLIMFLPQAKAWKLFGTEKSDRIGINELACGPGCVGESYSYTILVFLLVQVQALIAFAIKN